jgi:ammonia channel protein AmtB
MPAMVVMTVLLCVLSLLVALAGVLVVDGRLVPGRRLGLDVAVLLAGAVPWLALAPLIDRWFPVLGPLYVPIAILGAIATWLATIAPRATGADAGRVIAFALSWSVLAFVPAATIAFGTTWPLDHGGSLAVNIAPGAAALGVLLLGGPRTAPAAGRSVAIGAVGVAAVVLGWVGWLVFAELAVDAATPGIVLAGLVGSAGGVAGWLAVARLAHQATTLSAVAGGAITGVMAVTAGAALFAPLTAAVTGLIAGGAAALFAVGRSRATARPQWAVPATHLLGAGLGVVLIGVAGSGVGYIFNGQPNLAVSQLLVVVVVAGGSLLVAIGAWAIVRRIGGSRPPPTGGAPPHQ